MALTGTSPCRAGAKASRALEEVRELFAKEQADRKHERAEHNARAAAAAEEARFRRLQAETEYEHARTAKLLGAQGRVVDRRGPTLGSPCPRRQPPCGPGPRHRCFLFAK